MGFLSNKLLIRRIKKCLLYKGFEGAFINEVTKSDYTLSLNLTLPEHKELSDLDKIINNLKQEVNAHDCKIEHKGFKDVCIRFGMRSMDNISFDETYLTPNTLKVKFPTSFGYHVVDFEDSSSCHMLNGGVTRMGKTTFLIYLLTCLYVQNNGNIQVYISSAKLKDFYPFLNAKNVVSAKTEQDVLNVCEMLMDEYKKRSDMLYSDELSKATDAKSVRKLYPSYYKHFKPILFVIDEYARFSSNKKIQEYVTEIVETSGYLNIHVIIASQRPDASNVLSPRIKANLLVRLAFTTSDKRNSEIIIDRQGAESLGRIAGRGILVDSDCYVVQIPYISTNQCEYMLKPYQLERSNSHEDEKRYGDYQIPEQIQGHVEKSISLPNVQRKLSTNECSESCSETNVFEWVDNPNQT